MIVTRSRGTIEAVLGATLRARIPGLAAGDEVAIAARAGGTLAAGVVAVTRAGALLAPYGALAGVAPGDAVTAGSDAGALPLGPGLLGRAIGPGGEPLDGGGPPAGPRRRVAWSVARPRTPIVLPLYTGVRAIDALATIGRGARVGLFAGPGLGKSSLLQTIVAGAQAGAVVAALIGERARESAAWIAACDARTTVVSATAAEPPAARVRAARIAVAQAAALRDRGLHVLLVLDSLARCAAALREIGIAAGEPPGRGGFPPSVFAELARLLEAGGSYADGSLTIVATVLIDGDERDPVCEAAKALLDGHIVLCPRRAAAGKRPAIDVPASLSRTMAEVAAPGQLAAAAAIRAALAVLEESREARELGLAPPAADGALGRALAAAPAIEAFLCHEGPAEPGQALRIARHLADTLDNERAGE